MVEETPPGSDLSTVSKPAGIPVQGSFDVWGQSPISWAVVTKAPAPWPKSGPTLRHPHEIVNAFNGFVTRCSP